MRINIYSVYIRKKVLDKKEERTYTIYMNNEKRFDELGKPLITEQDFDWKGVRMENKEVMNLKEACEFLDFSRQTMYKMLKEKRIPASKVASQWKFIRSELIEWLKMQKGTRK